jgi:2-[(L-alanin-3-ylcarbamoyl)methyl]-2-hydroxybutanedioate decarboxylase
MIPERVIEALRGASHPVCAYVYDRATLRATAAALRDALPPGTLLCYAVKANGHPDVVATMAATVDGLEVASGGELALATAAGAGLVVFGGPAKTDTDLASAVGAGAVVNVESGHELRRLSLAAAAVRGGVTVCLRVNRAGTAALDGSHHMTGTPTPFGIDEAQLDEVVALAETLPGIELAGYHLHAVSNNLDAAAHAAFVTDAVDWSVAAAQRHGIALRYVNTGGGLGVDYTGPARFDLDVLHSGLSKIDLPDGARLVVEPGRFLAADAGWYAAEVLDLKQTHGRWFAVLRGGTHHFRLPAAWGYSHPVTVLPVEEWPYPFPRPEVRDAAVDVAGELCTPRDVLARDAPVDRLRVGDVMVFARAGAYGWDISHHEFLRHPYPQMLVI